MRISCATYTEIVKWVDLFLKNKIELLVVQGRAGIGKSSAVRAALSSYSMPYLWLEGRITPVYLYEQLYEYQDCLVFLDDVSALEKDQHGYDLIRTLCDTRSVKTVAWRTKTRLQEGTPRSFETTSRLCILANAWRYDAVLGDRGFILDFVPSAQELLSHVRALNLVHADVQEFAQAHIGLLSNLTIRDLKSAEKLHALGMPWHNILLESCGVSEVVRAYLEIAPLHIAEAEKVARWCTRTSKSAATYYRVKKEVQKVVVSKQRERTRT